jgi:hypothetical protein
MKHALEFEKPILKLREELEDMNRKPSLKPPPAHAAPIAPAEEPPMPRNRYSAPMRWMAGG